MIEFDDFFVVDEYVVAHLFQHWGIGCGNGNFVARLPHFGYRSDVIVMAVRFKNPSDSECLREFEEALMFIGCIDKDCLAGRRAANYEDVVVV